MNKKHFIKTVAMIVVAIAGTKLIQVFPWWTFVIPIFIIGIFISLKKWVVPCFAVGFITGFLIWVFANLYFHFSSDRLLAIRFGAVYTSYALLFSGIIGGLMSGLSLYIGKLMVIDNKSGFKL
ncbi:hypothetical protein AY601_2846 [Pedobacter cryoconitis]|uniref:Uncharacterized protein n=1 Tax=Pedobacter cryoconitis TaxID=188932 RepID=A0A127VEI6_9SPHI|nr:hypothetical protein [Pedobacter cryoconitis]AMP99724.1 hypothetical protein AY601_2846 [Pedobacter cryoconitis]